MTELFMSFGPGARLLIGVALAVVVLAVLAELGIPSILAGVAVFAVAHSSWGWDTTAAAWFGAAAALVAYVLWCLFKPRTKCWPIIGCGGSPRNEDGFGNWSNCLICGGSGQRKRIGSKILSRHRRFVGKG